MDIDPKAYVVGEVPAWVVGIFVENDVVAIPVPAIAETEVIWGDTEIESAKPESTGTTTGKMPSVVRPEASGKAAMLPGMIEMVVRVIGAGIVSDPRTVFMNMRSVGCPG